MIDCILSYFGGHEGAWTALATIVIAAFTIALVFVSWRQSSLIINQINLAREEFNATHRPRLVVRDIMLFPTTTQPTIKLRCVMANTGDGDGEITESHFAIQDIDNDLLMPLQPTEGGNPVGKIILAPSGQQFWEVDSRIGVGLIMTINQQFSYEEPQERKKSLYFRGFLVYSDKNKIRRRMSFCRKFDACTNSFQRIDNPDYEYSD